MGRHTVPLYSTTRQDYFLKKLAKKNTPLKMQFLLIKFGIGFKMLYLCIVEKERWNLSAGHQKFAFRPDKIFSLPRA